MFNQVIQPDTTIYLLKVPIEIDNDNQLTFANATDQYNYFFSRDKKMLEKSTYQRENNIIRFNLSYDEVIKYNYVMYENPYIDSNGTLQTKWVYAFITNCTYLNPKTTAIEISTDSFQTYQFDIVYKDSFVEREHVNDDIAGLHTIPELVENGEYIVDEEKNLIIYDNYYIVFAVTQYFDKNGDIQNSIGGVYGGVYSGLQYHVVKDLTNANNLMKAYAQLGKSEAIVNMFMIPSVLAQNVTFRNTQLTPVPQAIFAELGLMTAHDSTFSATVIGTTKSTSLNGYVPKNKKLLTFPFQYINLSNNVGLCLTYRYEDFSTNAINFQCDMTITPGMSAKLSPLYYKNLEVNFYESMSVGKIPASSWTTDLYTNWLTQNGINVAVSGVNAGMQIIGGLGMLTSPKTAMSGASSITGGLSSIASTIGQIYQHSIMPPSINGDTNTGDVSFSLGHIEPKLYKMCIKQEYARVIDNFFTMYGYKVNRLKVPNITGRPNFNYVKTIGCNIIGDIPQARLQEIKDLFNRGITLWHNPNTFLDYSVNNNI